MQSYSDIMNKFRGSKTKVEGLMKQIVEEKKASSDRIEKERIASANKIDKIRIQIGAEESRQEQLMKELQSHLADATGQSVTIGVPVRAARAQRKPTKNPNYNREAVVKRILELRDDGQSYDGIAAILNREGLKPLTAEKFSQATVHQMYKSVKAQQAEQSQAAA